MLVRAKQNNVPFVFLLKNTGDISDAVKRFADELGVTYGSCETSLERYCKRGDILLVVTYLGTPHRNSLSNFSSWAPGQSVSLVYHHRANEHRVALRVMEAMSTVAQQ
jgi:hypothetical protein